MKPKKLIDTDIKRNAQGNAAEDFMSRYVKYADIFEAPPPAHEAVAMNLIAAAVNGNVWIKNGGQHITLDMWTLLLSGSGVGRNTLLTMMRPVLKESGLENLVRNTSWGSKQAFYQDLAEHHKGFFLWEEMSASLKTLSDSRFGEAKQWLTNIYDNQSIPPAIRYRQSKSTPSKNTEPIEFTQAPRTNILATSSREWFINSISHEDSMGGFIPRWFLVDMPDLDRTIPVPKEPDNRRVKPLADHLQELTGLKGPADLSAVSSVYEEWYKAAKVRFASQPNKALAIAFWNRHRVHFLKLAVLFHLSESASLVVSPDAMQRAADASASAEKTIFDLLRTGMSHEGGEVEKMSQPIRDAGPKGMLRSEFTSVFQYIVESERASRLRTMIDAGTIKVYRRTGSGRPALVYVHKDHLETHDAEWPEDKEY
jgi:hypothetical protein